jgi:hypothetical protein
LPERRARFQLRTGILDKDYCVTEENCSEQLYFPKDTLFINREARAQRLTSGYPLVRSLRAHLGFRRRSLVTLFARQIARRLTFPGSTKFERPRNASVSWALELRIPTALVESPPAKNEGLYFQAT